MADPVTIVAMAATIAAGYGEYQQGKQEKKAYDRNAEILKRNAAQKRLETSINEDTMRSENRRRLSAARAALGESGMLDSATALSALGQMSADQEQQALNLRFSGESEAVGYLNQSETQRYYGKMAKFNGKNAFKMSFVKAGLQGLGSMAQAGAFSTGGKFGSGGIISEGGGSSATGSFSFGGVSGK